MLVYWIVIDATEIIIDKVRRHNIYMACEVSGTGISCAVLIERFARISIEVEGLFASSANQCHCAGWCRASR